jgi:hypothetical protein
MSLQAWIDHNADVPGKPDPFHRASPIAGDVIELDEVLLLEGEAAAESVRRFIESRDQAVPELLP